MPEAQYEREPQLDVREIVLIAVLSAVGGVLSTYIGYLGNLINRFFGVPFGAGQLIAGLHVLWPMLARFLVGRFGAGTLTGVTKGLVEFLSGGTHGVVIVLISFVEGLLVDLGLGISHRRSLGLTMLVGAVAAASNVFVFQTIYFSGISLWFVLFMAGLASVSGAFFGGYLAWDLHRVLIRSRIIRAPREGRTPRAIVWWRHLVTLAVVAGLLAGGIHYYLNVYEPFAAQGAVRIEGDVSTSYVFRYASWEDRTVSATAELKGSVTHVPRRDYVGVPLSEILAAAAPKEGTETVRVVAEDGYEVAFELASILDDSSILLSLDGGRLRLIAGNYDGAYWVKRVIRIVVE